MTQLKFIPNGIGVIKRKQKRREKALVVWKYIAIYIITSALLLSQEDFAFT